MTVLFFSVKSQDSVNYYGLIKRAIEEKELDFAFQAYNSAVQKDFYDIESLQRLICLAYYLNNQPDKSYDLAEKLYNEGENDFVTDILYCVLLAKQGPSNDKKIEQRCNESDISDINKSILSDISLFDKKDITLLINALTRIYDNDKELDFEERKTINTLLTLLYFNNNMLSQAYNTSIDYISSDNPGVIYYILGYIRQNRQEYASAVVFYDNAVKKGYNNYNTYLNRGLCKGYEKDYVSSNYDMDTCLMIDTNYYPFYIKGINCNLMHDYQQAVMYLDYSIGLNDSFALSYNYRGLVSSNMKEYQFAVLDFQKAVSLDKATPYVHNNLGIALEKTGKISQALEEYILSTETEPYLSDGWYNAGRVYTGLKETKKALKYLRKAMELAPEVPDTYYLLGINYQKRNDKRRACAMFHKALELDHTMAQDKINDYCNSE